MCECGCGEARPLVKLPAPNGGWYGVEIYPGCDNCNQTLWGLTIYHYKKGDEDGRIVLGGVQRAEFDKHGMWSKVILDYDVLRNEFAQHGGDDEYAEQPDIAPMFALNEMIEHGGMTRVFYDTLNKKPEGDDEARPTLGECGASERGTGEGE